MRQKRKHTDDNTHAQKADRIHQLVTIMRNKRGRNKAHAKDNIRVWLRHGLRVGLSYDELKALTIEIIREHKSNHTP